MSVRRQGDSQATHTQITGRDAVPAYVTKDGSEIRELMHPAVHPGARAQSLAEATVFPGQRTLLHRHGVTEELYHVTAGDGRMTLGGECFTVAPGDTVLIPPGTAHCIENTGAVPLRLLCCCAPAYSHDDTEVLEDGKSNEESSRLNQLNQTGRQLG